MTPRQALEGLLAAGLHARLMGSGISGGGYVDRSTLIGVVQDCFLLMFRSGGQCEVMIERLGLSNVRRCSLADAVDLVIATVPPGRDIDPPDRPPSGGTVYY